jgi:hypothetical protein
MAEGINRKNERLQAENDGLRAQLAQKDVAWLDIYVDRERLATELGEEIERLAVALRQILEDPDAKILDSHRDDGWAVLGNHRSGSSDQRAQ